ncbi:DoxX family protein [Aquimarina algicola]|uniref:DoxX family protein n=1 Tax=Aquimarina algicola TaxID=2589995 RepID=A0A504J502_9FLAO|nr:DoxX family protein [Aquimarina algicola]TPN82988.1 DoxX family protein [Aquimarina algicola]
MKIIYWLSTSTIAMFLLFSSYTYICSKNTIDGIRALGFPDFFRVELAVLKVIGAILIVLPFISLRIKEWAYAGIGLFLITALVAHVSHKDSIFISILLLILLGVLALSNIYMHKLFK